MRDEEAENVALDRPRPRVRRAVDRDQRRAVCRARGSAALRRAHLRASPHDARRAGRKLARNAERYLKSPDAMAQLFVDRRDALAGTAALAERLEYTMADLGYRFPTYPVPTARRRCRSSATSPTRARAIGTGRITTRRARRSRASLR
jgi:hypothetical protein